MKLRNRTCLSLDIYMYMYRAKLQDRGKGSGHDRDMSTFLSKHVKLLTCSDSHFEKKCLAFSKVREWEWE
jgi:hypothetical protein